MNYILNVCANEITGDDFQRRNNLWGYVSRRLTIFCGFQGIGFGRRMCAVTARGWFLSFGRRLLHRDESRSCQEGWIGLFDFTQMPDFKKFRAFYYYASVIPSRQYLLIKVWVGYQDTIGGGMVKEEGRSLLLFEEEDWLVYPRGRWRSVLGRGGASEEEVKRFNLQKNWDHPVPIPIYLDLFSRDLWLLFGYFYVPGQTPCSVVLAQSFWGYFFFKGAFFTEYSYRVKHCALPSGFFRGKK